MAKKRILVSGNIQDVGFRVFVKFNARKLGVKGLVRNLPDDTVEIFCDKDEKTLDNFIKAIDVKAQDGQTDVAHVDSIEVYDETEARYSEGKAPPNFEKFDVDYGEGLLLIEREELHRQEILVLHGSSLRTELRTGFTQLGETLGTKIDVVGQKVDGLGQKVDGVGQAVQSMHGDMNESFIEMDGKYHTIGENISNSNKTLEKMNENVKELTHAIKELVDDYVSEKRKRKDQGTGQT